MNSCFQSNTNCMRIQQWFAEPNNFEDTKMQIVNEGCGGRLPDAIESLNSLNEIFLFGNRITGAIPDCISILMSLKSLSLSSNCLTGPIPISITCMVRLEQLYLNSNALTGPIPEEIGTLTNLRALDISSNRISGFIPPSINNLKMLDVIDFFKNSIQGYIPSLFLELITKSRCVRFDGGLGLPSCDLLGQCDSNTRLDLRRRKLVGQMPLALFRAIALGAKVFVDPGLLEFPDNIGDLADVSPPVNVLDLRQMKLIGSIPPSIRTLFALTTLDIRGCTFTDGHENICLLESLVDLKVNDHFWSVFDLPPELKSGKRRNADRMRFVRESLQGGCGAMK